MSHEQVSSNPFSWIVLSRLYCKLQSKLVVLYKSCIIIIIIILISGQVFFGWGKVTLSSFYEQLKCSLTILEVNASLWWGCKWHHYIPLWILESFLNGRTVSVVIIIKASFILICVRCWFCCIWFIVYLFLLSLVENLCSKIQHLSLEDSFATFRRMNVFTISKQRLFIKTVKCWFISLHS